LLELHLILTDFGTQHESGVFLATKIICAFLFTSVYLFYPTNLNHLMSQLC